MESDRQWQDLPEGVAQSAVRNLKLALEERRGRVEDEELQRLLGDLEMTGPAARTRDLLLTPPDPDSATNALATTLSNTLLAEASADPELAPMVDEAIADAREAQTMDFGLSFLVLAGVVVLWRYRPKKVVKEGDRITIEWPEDGDSAELAGVLKTLGRAGGLG
jgi:hypothetical protein